MKNGPYELVIAPSSYPGKKYRGRYAYEHHVVFWEHHGQIPAQGEVVHHINGKKRDNRIENLALVGVAAHNVHHHFRPLVEFPCGFCKKKVMRKAAYLRSKLKMNRWGKAFCSRRCGTLHQISVYRSIPGR